MKKILTILFLLAGIACFGQTTLYKMVNGVNVPMSAGEANAIQAEWTAANNKRLADSIANVQLTAVYNDLVDDADLQHGNSANSLNANQISKLVLPLLFERGMIDTTGKIKPKSEWKKTNNSID